MNQFKEPYYLVDFTSSICNFEISINDVPVFNHEDNGNISSHYPINQFILETGKQEVKIKIYPLKNELELRQDSFLKVKIFCYDASTSNYEDTITTFTYETPDFSEKKHPIISIISDFEANIPYKNEGWRNSKDLNNDISKKELTEFLTSIHNIFKIENANALYEIQKVKFKEIDTSLFLVEDNLASLKNMFSNLKNEGFILQEIPKSIRFNLYSNNKIIRPTGAYDESVISYKNNNNETFEFQIFLHRKKEGEPLEIIR